ncbi:MAG: YHS domain-containing protein [Candidatus Eisenbacteria bacterium]
MIIRTLLAAGFFLALATAAYADCGADHSAKAAPAAQAMKAEAKAAVCPIHGTAVPANGPSVEYEGVAYSFCGDACLVEFQKNPAEYAVATCPVMHHEIKMKDATAKTEYDGKTYYFCSTDAKAEFEKNPEMYATFTCPLCGMTHTYAEAAATVQHEGKTVRFCGDACAAAFQKDPSKFMKKAEARTSEAKAEVKKDAAHAGCQH